MQKSNLVEAMAHAAQLRRELVCRRDDGAEDTLRQRYQVGAVVGQVLLGVETRRVHLEAHRRLLEQRLQQRLQ